MRFRFPTIDTFSFILGLILASLAWWIFSILRPAFQQMRKSILAKKAERQVIINKAAGIEERYRQSVLIHAQGLHLAAPLFSLDEIVEPPTLLAPPPRVEPGAPLITEDIVDTTVPYIPAWPELAAIYNGCRLTLAQALSGNSDIVLTGQTGMGKTVALAYLASRLARRNPEPGLPEDTLPFLFHVADLDLPVKKDDPLFSIINLIAEKAPVRDSARIPDFVRKTFSEGRALLLLDGTDELTPEGLKTAVEFIKTLKRQYPKTRMVTTASSEYLDGLVTLNFIPLALAAWNTRQRKNFLDKWGNLWTKLVAVEAWAQTTEQVDPILLNGWLNLENSNLTPLELTLTTWSAYAGDITGPRPIDAIETHLRRLSFGNAPREALEMLALQITINAEPIFDPQKAREWIKSFEPPELVNIAEAGDETKDKNSDKLLAPSFGLITKLVESGMLSLHRKNRMRFIHPIFCGYLAGKSLIKYKSESLFDQQPCIGKNLALNFMAAFGDATLLVDKLLSLQDRPLSRNLLTPARWLCDAPLQLGWRGRVMAKLVEFLRQTGQPLGLRGQALCALIRSGDLSVAVPLRQMLEEGDNDLQLLAALGCGALKDSKAIESLSILMSNQSPNVRRAACLALVNIGTTTALDIVASALLHGDEYLRRSAAEALANHPDEGYAMLKEGAEMKEDLLVRRSVAYGLGRITEPWAEELVSRLETVDDQWAVRNAAMEVTENRQHLNPHIPLRLPPPTESSWIIAFAGKQGLGVSPDKPPTELLLMALKSGTEEEKLASLAYLRMMPVESVFGALYQAMYGGEPTLREAAFQTFAEMAARGVEVPDPVQWGVGS
jgi:HEAT repeat protein